MTEGPAPGHRFQPYAWNPSECGYVDGDDMMCGYPEAQHGAPPDPAAFRDVVAFADVPEGGMFWPTRSPTPLGICRIRRRRQDGIAVHVELDRWQPHAAGGTWVRDGAYALVADWPVRVP